MKISEYMRIRNKGSKHNSLTNKEADFLGINIKQKGWFKNNKDKEVSAEIIEKCLNCLLQSSSVKSRFKNNAEANLQDKPKTFIGDAQYIYLMKNSHGLFKIGISASPKKREKSLTTASGNPVKLLAFWSVVDARSQEKYLHTVFKENRGIGEWFNFPKFSPGDLEEKLKGLYKRVG